jgi:hypothetical protein
MPSTPKKATKLGRPSSFTPKIAAEICDQIIEGKSLIKICEQDDMPGRRTILTWLDTNEDFQRQYARARELQADTMAEMILDEAKSVTNETAQAARVKIDALKWRASKLLPKRYGDRVEAVHDVQVGMDPAVWDRLQSAIHRWNSKHGHLVIEHQAREDER